MRKNTIDFLRGICIGISVLIPGMSGGTTAIVLQIYGDLLDAFSNIFIFNKKRYVFLLSVACGSVFGIFISARPLQYLLVQFEIQFCLFVCGIIVGTIPIFLKGFNISPISNLIFVILGFAATILINKLTVNANSWIFLILMAFLMAIALILPGISITNVLIAFGCYDKIIAAIAKPDIFYLLTLSALLLLSMLLTVKILDKIYKKYPVTINMTILGMVLASLNQCFAGFSGNIICDVLFVLSGLLFGLLFCGCIKRTN